MTVSESIKKSMIEVGNRIKNDTKEILDKIRVPKQKTQKINIWVGLFIMAISAIGVLLSLPLLGGMISVIFPSLSSSTVATPSAEAVETFILIAAALGTLILWFAERRGKDNSEENANLKEQLRLTKILGKEFLLSAMALVLFLLLSPLLPQVRDAKDGYSLMIKWICLLSFIGGSLLFIFAVLESFFQIPRM